MAESLIEQLPKIVAEGKKEVEKILERLSSPNKLSLQTNEYVLPSKDKSGIFRGELKELNEKEWHNRLVYGDNLLVMQALLAGDPATGLPSMRGKIDLIYIDPPFDSKADYRTKITLPGTTLEAKPTVLEQFAYSDTWKNGTASYLKTVYPRLVLMRELLSDTGSIYVHLDWHVVHYVKVILDEIFRRDMFRSEVVWKRKTGRGQTNHVGTEFGVQTDSILVFSKTLDCFFKNPTKPLRPEYIQEMYRFTEPDGRRYRIDNLASPSYRPNLIYEFKGYKPPEKGWAISKKKMDEWDIAGRLHYPTSKEGRIQRKRYLDENEGELVQNLWDDISVGSQSNERLEYGTQKPEKLLERIITASCPVGGVVGDFFAGSGTTGAVAEKLGRRWIMSDIGKPAIMITRKRLIDQESKPFIYQSIGDYQKEAMAAGRIFRRVGDLSTVVLNLYGALPFPDEQNPGRNLGYIKAGRTLVMVDSPSKLTGYATLKRAQELRETFLGGWEKVVVLGWNFAFDIATIIKNLNDPNLEVLVIPPDLLDKLKTKASYQSLLKSGKVRFSSLQYLSIKKPSVRNYSSDIDKITIELDNYVLLSPDALPLDEANKEKLRDIISNEPLTLIEYWSVDPDYDGVTFRSKWQDYRENTENDGDPFRVIKSVNIMAPRVKGKRKICVKAVDVFGFESVVVEEMGP